MTSGSTLAYYSTSQAAQCPSIAPPLRSSRWLLRSLFLSLAHALVQCLNLATAVVSTGMALARMQVYVTRMLRRPMMNRKTSLLTVGLNCRLSLLSSQAYTQSLPTSQYHRSMQSDAVPSLVMVRHRAHAKLSVFANVPTFRRLRSNPEHDRTHMYILSSLWGTTFTFSKPR